MFPRLPLPCVAALLVLFVAPSVRAGGGPETTVVVVNADSPRSLQVANEYVRLRRIPATHVCVLGDVPGGPITDIEAFRERIWKPLRAWLESRSLFDRVDLIAYSLDFPYAVDFDPDRAPPYPPGISKFASLTSMTYLARRVEKKEADGYLNLQVNKYFRRYSGQEAGPAVRRPTAAEARHHQEASQALQEKKHAEAAAAYERMLATYPEHAESWYNLACCRALLGKADEALAALGQAIVHGWSDAGHATKDADLESLRGRPEFVELLGRMEKARGAVRDRVYEVRPARAFSSRIAWASDGEPGAGAAADADDRYWLSVMLGYAGERGNSVPEILACLASAAGSDGTRPEGGVYFPRNDDIRSKTREPLFATAVSALRGLRRPAAILSPGEEGQDGILPVGKPDVVGACVGIAGFDWPKSGSRLLPGAIAEHLTSYGAAYEISGQTKISEFIRHGAAGSAGAVAEPYALQAKFPTPHLHVFYAEGCSLAEAFYQSVWGPYQLLIVGDPLARPFAHFAEVELEGPDPKAPWSGAVEVRARVSGVDGRPIGRVELWVDGKWIGEAPPGAAIPWDTRNAEDGAHEIRCVAVEADRIETRSFALARVTVVNGKNAVTVVAPKKPVAYGDPIPLSGTAPGAKQVRVMAGAREVAVATVKGGAWKAVVPSATLGLGASTLQVRSDPMQGDLGGVSPFVDFVVESPGARKPSSKSAQTRAGLLATVTDAAGKSAEAVVTGFGDPGSGQLRKSLEGKVAGEIRSIRLEGEFEVASTGWVQLDLRGQGALTVAVGGKPVLEVPKARADRLSAAMLPLEAGWHSVDIRFVPEGAPDLAISLGGIQPSAALAGKSLRHVAPAGKKSGGKEPGKGGKPGGK